MVLFLVYTGPYLYTGSKYKGYQAFLIENQGRGLQQPPFGGRVTKNTSGG